MKKIYRDKALAELLERLESRDFDRRESALFELAIMLRRANQRAGGNDPLSAADLPRDLSRIRLSPDEQRNIVDQLMRLVVNRRESRASAFWTLSEAAAPVAWAPVLFLLEACGHELDGEAAYQACRALRIWLDSGALLDEEIQRGVAARALQAQLRRWSRTGDIRLARAAQKLTDILNAAGE